MKTIETTATVNKEGTLVIELASDLPSGTHPVVLVIDEASLPQPALEETELSQQKTDKTAWTVLREQAGSVEMPEDWAKEHDHYLYGLPKRQG